jgi:hypothetical protein
LDIVGFVFIALRTDIVSVLITPIVLPSHTHSRTVLISLLPICFLLLFFLILLPHTLLFSRLLSMSLTS